MTHNDHLDHDVMSGVKLPPKAVENAKTQKEDFSDDELTRLFVALGAFRTYREPVMREWYWGVLMVAHSGCRATEIIQLLRSDVRQEAGIWYLNISDKGEGQRLKNKASKRLIPVHSNLLKAGLLDWFAQSKDVRLFPLLFPYGAVKTTQAFSRLLKKLGMKRKELTLHCFRNTMTIKLERARVHYTLMRRLLGHSIGKSVEDRVYLGSLKYTVKELSEALEMVSFPPVT